MINIIIAGLIALMLAAAIIYIAKTKKQGGKCIGCPAAGCCSAMNKNTEKCSQAGCGARENK